MIFSSTRFDFFGVQTEPEIRTSLVEFSPPENSPAPVSVVLSCPESPLARIFYTVDGTVPTFNSIQFYPGDTVNLATSGVIYAFAHEFGKSASFLRKAQYVYDQLPQLPVVEFTPPSTQVSDHISVSLTCPGHPDAEILYTVDGTDPEVSGHLYLLPIYAMAGTVVRAFARLDGWRSSFLSAATYSDVAPDSVQVTVDGTVVPQIVTLGAVRLLSDYNEGWKYVKGTAESSAEGDWRQLGFDDSTWVESSAPFWYGDVQSGGTHLTDMLNNYTTLYLRKEVEFAGQVEDASLLRFKFRVDDAVMIWVNGELAVNYHGPDDPAYNAVTSWSEPEPQAVHMIDASVPNSFVSGTNVIAVQVFNRALSSSDILFDAEISAVLASELFWSYNGSNPELYTEPLRITEPGHLMAYARIHGMSSPPVTVTFTGQLPVPEFFPTTNDAVAPTALRMEVEGHSDAEIYYTTDGTDPTDSSSRYHADFIPFFPEASTVLAFARKYRWADSPVTKIKLPGKDDTVKIAFIADYGDHTQVAEGEVSDAIEVLSPYRLIGVGDNTYSDGLEPTVRIQRDILDFYGSFVSARNFLTLFGNHDWDVEGLVLDKMLETFSYLPGKKRYYEARVGYAHLFFFSGDPREDDLGYIDESTVPTSGDEALYMREKIQRSDARWKIACVHECPYTSEDANRPGNIWMRFPFQSWGIDAVVSGDAHVYERLVGIDGLPYLIAGWAGRPLRGFAAPLTFPDGAVSVTRYASGHGYITASISSTQLKFQAITTLGNVVDELVLLKL